MNKIPETLLKIQKNTIFNVFEEIFAGKFDKSIEIEGRLGVIIDRQTGLRIDLGVKHPIIFSDSNNEFNFTSGVSDSSFTNILKIFSNLESKLLEEVVVIKNKIRTIFSDEKKIHMRKIRLKKIDIHLPHCEYDLRISFSREEIIPEGRIASVAVKSKVDFRRERKRVSVEASSFRFDLTTVMTGEKITKEVEVEILEADFSKMAFFSILQNLAGVS